MRKNIRVVLNIPESKLEELKRLQKKHELDIEYVLDMEEQWTNLDVIMNNLIGLKGDYEEDPEDPDDQIYFWEDEFGGDRTWQIDCHPVFSDGTPCLNEVRGIEYPASDATREEKEKWEAGCTECKARWLMEVYE